MERRGALLRPRRRLCGDPGRLRHAPHPRDQALRRGPPGYKVAGYWYADDPTTINNCAPCRGREIQAIDNDLQVITVTPGQPLPPSEHLLDVTEAPVKYLQAPVSSGGIGGLVTDGHLPLHRIAVQRLHGGRGAGVETAIGRWPEKRRGESAGAQISLTAATMRLAWATRRPATHFSRSVFMPSISTFRPASSRRISPS